MADKIALYVNDVLVYSQAGGTTQPPPVTPPPPPPPPPPGDPALAEFDRRAALGQWAAWKFWDPAAFGGLMARGHTFDRITQQIQWYNHDFVIPGNNAGGVIRYFDRHIGNFVLDQGGAADAYVLREATAQGRRVPGPVR